jgi:hypothetical protein
MEKFVVFQKKIAAIKSVCGLGKIHAQFVHFLSAIARQKDKKNFLF